jgi:gamma-D-glutamyl-L-lysine dipeptidyl-peptidase
MITGTHGKRFPSKTRHLMAACVYLSLTGASLASAPDIESLVVSVPVANMYSRASEESDVVSQAIYGSDLKVLEESDRWAKVRTLDDYTGWVRLEATQRTTSPPSTPAKKLQVSSQLANLYRETDVTAHRPVLTVPFETQLAVEKEGTGDDAGWFQVRLVDGQKAWIQSGDVITSSHPLTIDESITLAKRFLGVTYLWGGRSSLGFDCSGFTQMLVHSRGINMPRDADLQAAWNGVSPVDRKHLRAGDLLFFGSAPDHITHTGMYIGHGEFIHDTTHGHPGVQISRLKDQPWTRLLVASRRVK